MTILRILLCSATALTLFAAPASSQIATQGQGQTSPPREKEREQERERDVEREKRRSGRDRDPRTSAVGGGRPYRALFGGAANEPDLRKTLSLTVSASEVYDENLLADAIGPDVSAAVQSSGFYTNLVGDLTFRRQGERLQFVAGGGASARYYTSIQEFAASDYHAAVGLSAQTSRRSTLTVNQAFSLTPVYVLGLFASANPPPLGSVITPVTDYAVNDDRSYTTDSNATFVHNFSRRSSVTLLSAFRFTRYLVLTARGEAFNTVDAGGTYSYGLTRDTSLRLGYVFRRAEYVGSQVGPVLSQPVEHNLDIGLDFKRALSETRRTGYAFKVGSSIVSTALGNDFTRSRRLFRIVGDGSITQQLGETWSVSGTYQRGTGMIEGVAAPVFSDAWAVASNGFIHRRADLALTGGYSNGSPAAVGLDARFSTYTGNARLRIGLTRAVAATVEYLYYFYDFSQVGSFTPGFSPRIRRNSIRAGVSFWTPLIRR